MEIDSRIHNKLQKQIYNKILTEYIYMMTQFICLSPHRRVKCIFLK